MELEILYANSIRLLFPQGEFWDKQFADTSSDLSLLCKAKAKELVHLRARQNKLLRESIPETTEDCIEDWERVCGLDNRTLPFDVRKQELENKKNSTVNFDVLSKTALSYGANLTAVKLPYKPAVFGRSRFACQLSTPAGLNVIFLRISLRDTTYRAAFEKSIKQALLANQIPYFYYEVNP